MASKKAERIARKKAKKVAMKKAGEKERIGRSGLGRTASDAGARTKLIINTWEALEKATRVVWQPFATLKAETPTGKKVIVQLATSRKVLPNRMLNFFGLDNKLYLKTTDFLKSRVKPSDVLNKSPPQGRTKGFVTFEVRKKNVAEWLEAYFKQVNDMPNAFNLTVTELMSESSHPRSPYAVPRRPRFFT
jgi:hypothetical protein